MEHDIKVGDEFLVRNDERDSVTVLDLIGNEIYYKYDSDEYFNHTYSRRTEVFLREFKKQDNKEPTMKYKVGQILKRVTDSLISDCSVSPQKGKKYIVLHINTLGYSELSNEDGVFKNFNTTYLDKHFEIVDEGFSITIATTTNDMTLFKDLDGVAKISCGCFLGTLSEAMDLAKSKQRDDYISAVTLLTEIANSKGMLLEPVKTYNIELTEDECKTLAVICQHIGGNPLNSDRKHVDSLDIKLNDMGFNGLDESIVDNTDGSIHFKEGSK